jgi:hypothetical protein
MTKRAIVGVFCGILAVFLLEVLACWRGARSGPRESFDAPHFCTKKVGIFRSLNTSVDRERNDSIISPFETT